MPSVRGLRRCQLELIKGRLRELFKIPCMGALGHLFGVDPINGFEVPVGVGIRQV